MQRLQVNPQILQKPVDEGCVLIHKITGDCYELNHLGSVVWNRLHAGESIAAMAAVLAVEYGVSTSQLESDLNSLLADLINHGLVLNS